jgi:hypothetical protein
MNKKIILGLAVSFWQVGNIQADLITINSRIFYSKNRNHAKRLEIKIKFYIYI